MEAKDLRALSLMEIEAKLNETRTRLFQEKFRHQSTPLKNPLEIRNLRREIARITTIIKEMKQNRKENK